jgi:hypothetical protein
MGDIEGTTAGFSCTRRTFLVSSLVSAAALGVGLLSPAAEAQAVMVTFWLSCSSFWLVSHWMLLETVTVGAVVVSTTVVASWLSAGSCP